jgi:hypothetical protein
MVHKSLIAALSILAASPLAAANLDVPPSTPAPPGGPATLYCLRVTITGNIAEPVQCWTRDEWWDQGVDVDKEWAKNGVRTYG